LIDWVAQQKAASVNLHYDVLGQVERPGGEKVDVKQAIVRQRLKDQGYLCAYTMVGISEKNCHVEHIVPRSDSNARQQSEETVRYDNMLACYPQDDSKGKCPFGAHAREDRPLPLTPLDATCEKRMRFRKNGQIEPLNSNDLGVSNILDEEGNLLRLNHPRLVLWRREAIHAVLFSGHSPELSITAARRFAKRVLEFRWGERLRPYCIALAHAATEHADNLEKLRRKKRFSKS
jgi:uncharacterized protein (TIGR02646 family)